MRGRHRKPRPRKVLLAAGGLALAAGALSLLRLSGPAPDGPGGTHEAGPLPGPVTTGTDGTGNAAATRPAAPEAGPSSPTALGGLTPSPLTKGASPAEAAATAADGPRGTTGAPEPATTAPGSGSAPTPVPDEPNARDTPRAPAPTASAGAPDPAPAPPAPPSRTTPAPPPPRGEPEKPRDPGLCVPIIGLCVDTPLGALR
ncbi:hypothetical protein [Streptomyces sp. AHA2]|uniref:hypothetical protein n=1 Tax=Streptomyces sp. AHA2 TaxID=3064526 RepID=UPI002FE004E0